MAGGTASLFNYGRDTLYSQGLGALPENPPRQRSPPQFPILYCTPVDFLPIIRSKSRS